MSRYSRNRAVLAAKSYSEIYQYSGKDETIQQKAVHCSSQVPADI